MIFPAIELKFSQIQRTANETTLVVRLYRVDDGGIVDGQQRYLRTVKRARTVEIGANRTRAEVLAWGRQKVQEWASEEGFNLPDDRLLCSL